jgi:hypothetical protein
MVWQSNRPTHVPSAVRAKVLERDGYRCVAALRDGSRCPGREQLEAAHRPEHPWREGEQVEVEHLRTLCHWHHNRETQAEAARARAKNPSPSAKHPREKHPGLK